MIPYLFTIEKEQKKSYLLGSAHIAPFTKFEEHEQKFLLSHKVFVGETSMFVSSQDKELEQNVDVREKLKKLGGLKEIKTDYSGDELLLIPEEIRNTIEETSGNLKVLDDHKITIHELTFYGILRLYCHIIKQHGINYSLRMKYESQHKEIYDLDDPSETHKLHEYQQENLLGDNINAMPEILSKMKSIVIDYNCATKEYFQDTWTIDTYSTDPELDDDMYNCSLRNVKWLPKINALATKQDDILFCVGQAHLDYESGLINLLMQEGFIVKPVGIDQDGNEFNYPFTVDENNKQKDMVDNIGCGLQDHDI